MVYHSPSEKHNNPELGRLQNLELRVVELSKRTTITKDQMSLALSSRRSGTPNATAPLSCCIRNRCNRRSLNRWRRHD